MSRSSIPTWQSGTSPVGGSAKADIPRSSFDRSSSYKTAIDSGGLYPFFLDEVVPGDTFNLKTSGICRLSTPIFPVMDNMYFETFYFFVPTRLIWDNFEKMMGEQDNPGDTVDYLAPVTSYVDGFVEDSLADYFGLPTNVPNLEAVSLPFRAYLLIWNEWFRDQNLEDSRTVPTDDGPDDPGQTLFVERRGKRHDYFTSCLPWPFKGPAVEIPSTGTAPITGLGSAQSGSYGAGTVSRQESGTLPDRVYPWEGQSDDIWVAMAGQSGSKPAIFADMENSNSATVNQLRQAFQIQKMYERDARGGSRYTEIIRSHFGVVSPDARLQRPEYLGGGHTPVNVNPIYQSAETTESNIGRLSGVGVASFANHGFVKSFTEHGYIIGMCNVRADMSYQQGLNRMWKRRSKLAYYWPALSHIGEQAVDSGEIYTDGTTADQDVFGYQERYAEYRYKPSIVTGAMRSSHTTSLDAWHLAYDFDTRPLLNKAFIQDYPPIDRVVAVPSEPQFICDFYHKLTCARPMPMYGTPGYIDHF